MLSTVTSELRPNPLPPFPFGGFFFSLWQDHLPWLGKLGNVSSGLSVVNLPSAEGGGGLDGGLSTRCHALVVCDKSVIICSVYLALANIVKDYLTPPDGFVIHMYGLLLGVGPLRIFDRVFLNVHCPLISCWWSCQLAVHAR